MNFVLQWIDLAWLVMAMCMARKDQRGWVFGFFMGSMLMMRLLSELMDSIGYPNGLIGLMDTPVRTRGLMIYSIAYVGYMAFIRFSLNAKGTLLMAASLGFFFMSFFITAIVMVL
jgi:hypothetical protein